MLLSSLGVRRRAILALAGAVLVSAGGIATSAEAQDIRTRQWYLDAMKADDMWKVSQGQGVIVAVVDTGVDASLPELRGQVLQGADVSSKPKNPRQDPDGHGTNMAALIAGNGASGGIQGLAPKARVLPVRSVVDDDPDVVQGKAIRYAVDHGARVINISAGTIGLSRQFPLTQAAVTYALKNGSLIFAATGNNGDEHNGISQPAGIPGVVGVAAIDSDGKVPKWSTHGDQVALAAAGVDMITHCTESKGLCKSWGTSQATAITSASAALIWSKHPKWTNNQVLRVMMQTASPPAGDVVPSSYLGYGSIRPRKVLLDGEGEPGPANVNPLLLREGATDPKPSASASVSESPNTNPQPTPTDDQKGDKKTVAEPKKNDDNSSTLWIAIGAGIAVLLAAAVAIVLVRRRSSASAGL
ncbi:MULTISPECIES: S8 family serine peptidase [Streptomyces]|uniref:S8 family serine peptidase n=1 Tax=Streptomyces lonegramiae TaxID=3075524 RepID=A0ABU2XMP6_9ACTN|nr:S8 family serine peptidase [Streptomyces sp. DSM 41529]MDT0547190.1 S8 family serine peptidase [Streptomyces sp. DSM 41529]